MIRRSIVLLVLATMVGVAACASMSVHPHREIFDDVPAKIDPGTRYLFHMHGWVVEALGPAGAVSTGYWWAGRSRRSPIVDSSSSPRLGRTTPMSRPMH